MHPGTEIPGFDELSIEDKIRVVQDLWDRIAEESGASVPTAAQRRELDRRLEAIDSRDDQSTPWSVVRDRIRSKR
ncbi:MAG: addiction module protein [Myxococcota bacterium]